MGLPAGRRRSRRWSGSAGAEAAAVEGLQGDRVEQGVFARARVAVDEEQGLVATRARGWWPCNGPKCRRSREGFTAGPPDARAAERAAKPSPRSSDGAPVARVNSANTSSGSRGAAATSPTGGAPGASGRWKPAIGGRLAQALHARWGAVSSKTERKLPRKVGGSPWVEQPAECRGGGQAAG